MSTHRIGVELDGIITLLARHLYRDPDLFLRELLQNAHDSIVKRGQGGSVRLVPGPDWLDIVDDGAGLSEDEIHRDLSTIGRSGTARLRARLERQGDDPQAAQALIGQFGIGLLSAFLVAHRVELHTRAPGHPALRWTSEGGREYTLLPGDRDAVGTTVRLHLRPASARYTRPSKLRAIIRTWADFLGVPVFIGDAGDPPVNAVRPPWLDGEDACARWWAGRLPPALALLPMTGQVGGVLGIPERGPIANHGGIDIFVRAMLVERACTELLPPWARFIHGVVQCDTLQPTASRDAVVRDAAFDTLRRSLLTTVTQWLTRLSQRDDFATLARVHARSLMQAWLDARPLLALSPLDLPVPTTSSPTPLRELDPPLRMLTDADPQRLELFRARGLTIIDASDPVVERFVRATVPQIQSADPHTLFAPAGPVPPGFSQALPDVDLRLSRFQPRELPAVMVETAAGRSSRRLAEHRQALPVPSAIAQTIDGYLRHQAPRATLHMNADHPLIQQLSANPDPVILAALRDRARLLLHPRQPLAQLTAGYRREVSIWRRALSALEPE